MEIDAHHPLRTLTYLFSMGAFAPRWVRKNGYLLPLGAHSHCPKNVTMYVGKGHTQQFVIEEVGQVPFGVELYLDNIPRFHPFVSHLFVFYATVMSCFRMLPIQIQPDQIIRQGCAWREGKLTPIRVADD